MASAEDSQPFGIQSVNGVELGMPLSEAAAVLEEAGFSRYQGKHSCLEGTPDRTTCTIKEAFAGKDQLGQKVTWTVERSTLFTNNDIKVNLVYSSAEFGALVYSIERIEDFGRYVVDFEPIKQQISERAGPIMSLRPCSGGGRNYTQFSYVLDKDWNYVSAAKSRNGWKPEINVPSSFCGGIGWSPINGSITRHATWMHEQPEGSVKYTTSVSYLVDAWNTKIKTFRFLLVDNELAAQTLTMAHLVAVEKMTPEKALSSDF